MVFSPYSTAIALGVVGLVSMLVGDFGLAFAVSFLGIVTYMIAEQLRRLP